MEGAVLPTNPFQTPVTEAWLGSMSDWVRAQFMDCMERVPLLRWMASPDRPRARDLPRDAQGRIVVDVAHPHILEDVGYFRPAARFFEENGRYTFLKPNPNPRSEYGRWFTEERRRCREGYVRESDGEWVTGPMYWFLNYCRIMKTESDGSSSGRRVDGFPDFWEGIYYRFHYMWQARRAGLHCIELSRRGSGKSFTFASILSHNLILGEDEAVRHNVTTVLLAYSKEYLMEGKDGTFRKFTPMLDFLAANTSFPRRMLKASPTEMTWMSGYKDENGNSHGARNTVLGVSIKDDESKVRGKRGNFLFEEIGTFGSLLSTYDNLRDSVKDGDVTFGQIYMLGTAGDSESDFSGARTILYDPERYDIFPLENVYDRAGEGGRLFGYFFPAYMSRKGCMDADGNSDVTLALRRILEARDALRGGDSSTFTKRVAEQPVTPSEAIVRVQSSFFPVDLVNERLRQLDADPHRDDDVYVGDLVESPSGVEFRATGDVPVRRWPVDNDNPGAVEVWEMPVAGPDGRPQQGRYCIGVDPYDNDMADSDSLFSAVVLDLFTDRLVAEYTGRKPFAEDCYAVVYRLCLFYNAACCYESNRKGMFAYFTKRRALWMLADCPQYLRDRQLVKYSMFGSNRKGVNVNAAINSFAVDLIRDWLKKPVRVAGGPGPDGSPGEDAEVPNCFLLRSYPLLQELAGYGPGRNTDRVSALAQAMLYREQFVIMYGGADAGRGGEAGGGLEDDEAFEAGWRRRRELLRRRGF